MREREREKEKNGRAAYEKQEKAYRWGREKETKNKVIDDDGRI